MSSARLRDSERRWRPLPRSAAGPRRSMPTVANPEPPPFGGFHSTITLSKHEVLDCVATLEEVIADLGVRDLLDQTEDLANVRHRLLSRLQR